MKKNLVGLIGWPVEHSLSALMHNAAFQYLGLSDWEYQLISIPPESLKTQWPKLMEKYHGFNVTIPHKKAVLSLLTGDEKALAIGAANTIVCSQKYATNTDAIGFLEDLRLSDISVKKKRVLIIGAGGAARAAIYGLKTASANIAIINRDIEKAQELKKEFLLAEVFHDFSSAQEWKPELVVNCTSVGMWPKVEESPWPDDVPLLQNTTIYDMVYRPQKTKLLLRAEKSGLKAVGGLGMLVGQGAAAFHLWTGKEAPQEIMRQAIENQV